MSASFAALMPTPMAIGIVVVTCLDGLYSLRGVRPDDIRHQSDGLGGEGRELGGLPFNIA
jgi:hypothetical protein